MDLNGKINVFVTDVKGYKFYRGSISKKSKVGETETHDNYYIDVEFDKENFPAETLAKLVVNKCYVLNVVKGWLSFRSYEKDGKTIRLPLVHVKEATIEKVTDVKATKNELPF